jgi:small subunit ribosomal protein S20
MANHKSALKRIRQTATRTVVNHARVSQIRTTIRKVEEAIASGNKSDAKTAFASAEPLMMRGANRGVVNASTMSRKLSRLSARIKALA